MSDDLERAWKSFRNKVIHTDAGEIQVSEMRKTFYSGAWVAISLMISFSDDNISEEKGALMFEALRQECFTFIENELKRLKVH